MRRPAAPRQPKPAAVAANPYAADYAQAGTLANAQLQPIVAALASQIQRQTSAGIGAIQGYTGQLAGALGGEQQKTAGIWGAAQQAQAAQEAAFSQRLSGGGDQLAGELSQRLASVNAPAATGQAAANVKQTGAGAGNAAYGTGSAAMGQLIAQGAAAEDYAAKLPSLARLGGVQAVRDFGLKQQGALADSTTQLLAQAPGLQNQALSYIQGQKVSAASAKQTAESNRQKAAQQKFENIVALGYDPATGQLTQKAQNELTRLGQQQDAITQRGTVAKKGREQKNAAVARPNAALSKTYGIVVDSNGSPILRNGKPIPVAKTKGVGKGGALTAGQKATLRKQAAKEAETYYYGVAPVKRADGSVSKEGTPGLDYSTAIRRLMAQFSLTQREAQDILNDYYAPGEDGRPARVVKPKPDIGFRGAKL